MNTVTQTQQASSDLFEIWEDIARNNPQEADQFIHHFDDKVKLLAQNPELGRSRDPLHPALQSAPVGNYRLYYLPQAKGIEIVRVLNSYKDIDTLFI
ncbi:type II toxin-antitoxin system RelE/ParE family toxin [Rapidithrix thailandica]|uniref:Type II toxin-antitoxin system RelE/ParE family toxin n=1 Tax=Rapidithrix thailandica TaxID=413964 RepID=A0AAW9S4F5_9BACT